MKVSAFHGAEPGREICGHSGRVTPHITWMLFPPILTSMKTLLIISILGIGFSLTGCVVPVAVEHRRDYRHYDDGRNGYPVRVDVVPVINVRR